jgi:serine/threonine-protein kinase
MVVARYELRSASRIASERPTILEMLALRKAAQRVVELTEVLLLSMSPVVAGRTGPLKFAAAMAGPSYDEARQVIEQVTSQVSGLLPDSVELQVDIVRAEPHRAGRTLID